MKFTFLLLFMTIFCGGSTLTAKRANEKQNGFINFYICDNCGETYCDGMTHVCPKEEA